MALVLGVDGCPKGWCVVSLETDSGELIAKHYDTFAEILQTKTRTIAIDIPIGLMEGPGGRDCDRQARAVLGATHASSIFSPPVRQALHSCGIPDRHPQATALNAKFSGKGISIQSFYIGPKICEVDHLMVPRLERRVHEAHPEVSFAVIASQPIKHKKSTTEGRAARWRALKQVLRLARSPRKPAELRGLCDLEDYIDALVCAWTAERIFEGEADSLPEKPPRDPRGLRMAIWRPRR